VSGATSRPDVLFLPLTVPGVTGIGPTPGSTAGGTAVTITGTGFQPDAVVSIGGVAASNASVLGSTSITATAPAHPVGVVDVTVTNPGNQTGTLGQGYAYVEPANPVHILLAKSGTDVVISWAATGQPSYTVFRQSSPAGFTGASIRGATSSTTFPDLGGLSVPGTQFYQVD
jgi:hypothetical protein